MRIFVGLILMAAMAFAYGCLVSYLAILNQALKTLGYFDPDEATGLILIGAMFAGIFATPFYVSRLKSTFQYKKIILICNILFYFRCGSFINHFCN